ncbi:MAG: CRISPR-associated protein [Candidatus Fischerbacteria bacterium RBG_13_37_8]|uniref:CRISPR-associated protein n=1 Tax=Candidatus Fischerbacteria bacterium RBG_13_37_8 TaxID=1817863 RepID=A0A1F5VY11_9BACT|nr:MAG: CRISPR-associated protein [Candidatus Fischerbacteria bacterium RBG_13_37_8]
MNSQYDFYASFQIETKEDVDDLTRGSGKYAEIQDVHSRIMLLSTAFGINSEFPDRRGNPGKIDADVYAKVGEGDYASGLKALIHSNGNFNEYISCKLSELYLLDINSSIDISALPKGSWVIEFPITLAKPFISRDDVPLYIIENQVRKEKVFGVPFISAMAWKGNLRWAMMKASLEPKVNDPNKFNEIRFQHTLLFGTEKASGEDKGWTCYLDGLCYRAKEEYRNKLKEKFGKEDVPNLAGMLHFYATFWDRIDMEVINPHDRKTKTGKNPIYFEVVPAGAKGFFRLVYAPFYHFELHTDEELKEEIAKDLLNVIAGLKEIMITYGFSAKKSSGYGVIKNSWDESASKLVIKDFVPEEKFGNFGELEAIVKK